MMKKYQTKTVTAASLREGVTLYHGGTIQKIRRIPFGVIAECSTRTLTFHTSDRVTIYPNL